MWSELGDCHRFSRSEQVVCHSGLDVTVDASDLRRAGGFWSRQGPATLRWACYAAAKNASHHRSPDHDYYGKVKDLRRPLATPTSRDFLGLKVGTAHFHITGLAVSSRTGVPASIRAGRPSKIDADGAPTIVGDTQSKMSSSTTPRSSSTQVTQGAPAPSSLGP